MTERYPSAVPATTLDWFSAAGSALGTLGAVAAVVIAIWTARREDCAQRADRADRDAAQARLISTELRQERGRWWVRTINDSAAPVFHCTVLEVRHPLGARTLETVPGSPVRLRRLGPDQSNDRAVGGDGDLTDGVPVLRFVDAAGLLWYREGDDPPYRASG